MSLQDERRAIQERNTKERRASDGADARRQAGRDMIERRTGVKQVEDINAFLNPPRQTRALRTLESRGGVPASRGTGVYTPPATGTGGGIASPLTEVADSRVFHPTVLRPSTDGAVFFEVRAAKTVTMTDANGAQVVMEYANVTA